jgi:hypothetical protein
MEENTIKILKEISTTQFTRKQFLQKFNSNTLYYLLYKGYIKRINRGNFIISEKGLKIIGIENNFSISFGIEFEGNCRSKKGIIINPDVINNRYFCIDGWGYQTDPTATFELRSPVFKDINEAFISIKNMFKEWINYNDGIVPFFKPNKLHKSVGGHIHIGIGKDKKLNKEMAQKLTDKIIKFLPYLYFINANGTITRHLSCRLIDKPYTLLKEENEISDETRQEFWLNKDHGTIEFRRFDANIPAVQLAIIFLMKSVLESNIQKTNISMNIFQKIVRDCCSYPTKYNVLLDVRKEFEVLRDLDISNLPFPVKQVLVLSFCFLKNPSTFVGTFSYDFCRNATENCGFLEENHFKGEKKKIVSLVNKIAKESKTLGDLLNIIILDKQTQYLFSVQKIKGVFSTLTKDQSKIVEKYLKNPNKKPPFIPTNMWKNMQIILSNVIYLRLKSLNYEQIKQLEKLSGRSYDEMLKDVARYIVKVVDNNVVGYILVNMLEYKFIEFKGNIQEREVKEICENIGIKYGGGR